MYVCNSMYYAICWLNNFNCQNIDSKKSYYRVFRITIKINRKLFVHGEISIL